ncbi:uncharacterized protein LOC117301031 [Asterias rubens]|uniref:uncharacterized protein LOC117301031 n=1 Tax=Asterias rubens TaxID=7604 RepID=UPI001454EA29|nr:uncharacterized protein LOC117301031 [Asterias rubens]
MSSDSNEEAPTMFLTLNLNTFSLVLALLALNSLQATSGCVEQCISDHRAITCPEQNLQEIPQFENCDEAISLDLTNNLIKNISRTDFDRLPGLNDQLYLAGNHIQEIVKTTFTSLTLLRWKLDLQRNQLQKLENGSFSGLGRLNVLNLDHNRLTVIQRGVFGSDLPGLKKLSLAYNTIQGIITGSFEGMTTLDEINLRNNNITILLNNTFKGLRKVQTIDLSQNKIQVLEMSAFRDLASLTHLNLSFNEIVSVAAIHDLRALDVLDLHNNFITKLNSFLNLHLVSINYQFDINVSSNPLDCECESIQPLLNWYSEQQDASNGRYNNVAKCNTPAHLRDIKLSSKLVICDETVTLQPLANTTTLTSGYTTSSRKDAMMKTTDKPKAWVSSVVTGVTVCFLIICSVVLSYKSYRRYKLFTQSRPMVPAQLPNPTSLTTRRLPSLPRLPSRVTTGRSIVPQRSVSRHSMLALWSQGRIYFTRVRSSSRQSLHQPDRHDVSVTGHLSTASTPTGFHTTSSVSPRLSNHNRRQRESNTQAIPSPFLDRSQSTTTNSQRRRSQVESYITRIFTGNHRKRSQLQPVSQDSFAQIPNGDMIHTRNRWDANTEMEDDINFSTAPYSRNHDATTHWVKPSRVRPTSPMATKHSCNSSRSVSSAAHERRGLMPRPTARSECGNHVKGYSTHVNQEPHHKPWPPLESDIITIPDYAPPAPPIAGHLILTNSYNNVSSNCSGLSTTVGERDWPIVPQRPSQINSVKQTKRAWLQENNSDHRSITSHNATSIDQPPPPSMAGHLDPTNSYSNVSSNCSGLSTTVGERDWPTVPQRPSQINSVRQTKRAWLQEDNSDFRSITCHNATSTDQPPPPSMAGHLDPTNSYSNVSSNCSGLSTTVGERDWPTVPQRPSQINSVKQTKRAWLQENNSDHRSITSHNATSIDQPPPPSMAGHLNPTNSYSNVSSNCSELSTSVGERDWPTVPQRPSQINSVKQTKRAWLQENNSDHRSITGHNATSIDQPPPPSMAGHLNPTNSYSNVSSNCSELSTTVGKRDCPTVPQRPSQINSVKQTKRAWLQENNSDPRSLTCHGASSTDQPLVPSMAGHSLFSTSCSLNLSQNHLPSHRGNISSGFSRLDATTSSSVEQYMNTNDTDALSRSTSSNHWSLRNTKSCM